MEMLIQGYIESCERVKSRIAELTAYRNQLSREGRSDEIDRLDLERRIALLYTEHREMQEIIACLDSYFRRIQNIAKT